MADINLIALAVNIIVNVIILSPVLWIAGRLLAGKDKAKFTDALWIVVLGTVIGAVFQAFFPELGILGLIIVLVIWLALVKHFFDTGWLKALAIAIVAIIIYIIIVAILVLIGLAIIIGGSLFI